MSKYVEYGQEVSFYPGYIPEKAKIYEVKTEQVKAGSKWQTVKVTGTAINKQYYINAVSDDTLRWFRSIGGTEVRKTNYTQYGVVATEVYSTSPDKKRRSIREYFFEDEGYRFYLAKRKAEIKRK